MPKKRKRKKRKYRRYKTLIHNGVIMDHLASMSEAEIKVYMVIGMYANWETGLAFPATDLIKEYSGFGRKAIRTAAENLVDRGLITLELRRPINRKGRTYGRKRYFYRLTYPANSEYIIKH